MGRLRRRRHIRHAFAGVIATAACIALIFSLNRQPASTEALAQADAEPDEAAIILSEVRSLFHNQIQAIQRIGISRISITPSQRGWDSARLTAPSHDVGGGSVRAIIWNEEHPDLVVWRTGPVTDDLEARAPRWWISPAALATDHGLIRFLDLVSEPPLNP